jgi:poly(3-hydroxybutyrate) depolymerase
MDQTTLAGTDIPAKKRAAFTWVDWLLLAVIVGLSIHLAVAIAEPAAQAWHSRLRPGMQVARQYLVERCENGGVETYPINCLVYLPPTYDASRKWPLVVFLHGAGARGDDLNLVRRGGLPKEVERKKFDFILVSPQCRKNSGWMPELVVGLTEQISSSLSVDRDRVYLTGYSMGGNGTWAAACYDPGRFAAIAPLSGGGDAEQADKLKMPVWVFHGAKDRTIPLADSQTMVDAIRKCRGTVRFTIYPDQGHGISDVTYQNPKFLEWLLAQRRKQAPPGTVKPATSH